MSEAIDLTFFFLLYSLPKSLVKERFSWVANHIIELFGSCGTQVIAKEVEEGARFHGFYLGIPYKGGTLKDSATRKQ